VSEQEWKVDNVLTEFCLNITEKEEGIGGDHDGRSLKLLESIW
jgi:hypothetical protein